MTVVSVCIASFNHARFLPRCLDSILAQTFQDLEIVVVDDGSTDNSHEILLDYQQRYPDKILYFWHPQHANKGISVTSNKSILESHGKYIAFIGSDDVWRADKLELQIALMERSPELGMVYSYATFIDKEDQPMQGLVGSDITHNQNPTGQMLRSCHQPAMTVVMRRDLLDQIGLFDETLISSDWDLMIRFFAHGKAGFIEQSLANYRLHHSNLSKNIDPQIELNRYLNVMIGIEEKSPSIGGELMLPRNQAILALQLSFYFLCLGDELKAVKYLHKAFRNDRTLHQDVPFLNDWMDQWKPNFYTVTTPHLGFWSINHLPPSIPVKTRRELTELQINCEETFNFLIKKGIESVQSGREPSEIFQELPQQLSNSNRWRARIVREIYRNLLFMMCEKGSISFNYKWWLKAVRLNPSLIGNKGVWSIGMKSWFCHIR